LSVIAGSTHATAQLKIAHGFVGNKNAVGVIRQGLESDSGTAIREIRIDQSGCLPHGFGVDAINVLQILADIGISVLHSSSRYNGRQVSQL
jgi:hypothetical protein